MKFGFVDSSRGRTAGLAALLLLLFSTPAFAVATVYVTGYVGVQFLYYQAASGQIFDQAPAGVLFGCSEQGFETCETTWTLAKSNTSGSTQHILSIVGGELMVRNATDQTIGGQLFFLETFSAYAPGSQGVHVDDPTTELASFDSYAKSPDIYFQAFNHIATASILDLVSCATSLGIPTCGASDPGGSFLFAMPIAAPGAFSYTQAFFQGGAEAELIGVPEPPSWSYFAGGTVFLGAYTGLRRRRAISRTQGSSGEKLPKNRARQASIGWKNGG